jgi:hypothetical protein
MQDILRSLLTANITRERSFTYRNCKYRPRIDRLVNETFCGAFSPIMVTAVDAVATFPAFLCASDRSTCILLPELCI